MNTEQQLRDRFATLTEPDPLDPDLVVGAARGRKTRRDVLQLGAGTAAVGALAGLTWLGWGQVSGQRPSPAGTPTASEPPDVSAPSPTFTMPPAKPWPVKGDILTDTIYLVDGNLGFSYSGAGWSFWDLTKAETLNAGDWFVDNLGSTAFANCRTGVTDSDGYNYWGTLVPGPVGSVTMKMAKSGEPIVVSGNALPSPPEFVLLYWHARPGALESGGDFLMTLEPGPGKPPMTIRLKG